MMLQQGWDCEKGLGAHQQGALTAVQPFYQIPHRSDKHPGLGIRRYTAMPAGSVAEESHNRDTIILTGSQAEEQLKVLA